MSYSNQRRAIPEHLLPQSMLVQQFGHDNISNSQDSVHSPVQNESNQDYQPTQQRKLDSHHHASNHNDHPERYHQMPAQNYSPISPSSVPYIQQYPTQQQHHQQHPNQQQQHPSQHPSQHLNQHPHPHHPHHQNHPTHQNQYQNYPPQNHPQQNHFQPQYQPQRAMTQPLPHPAQPQQYQNQYPTQNGVYYNGTKQGSMLSLTETPLYGQRVNSYSSQTSNPPYPMYGNRDQQRTTSLRKLPPGPLPPLQTNLSTNGGSAPNSANGERRIVSSPTVPSYNTTSQSQELRTRSLTSSSLRSNAPTQGQRMEPIPQGQQTYQNHRPGSSSSGSSSLNTFTASKSRSFSSLGKLSSLSTKKFNSSASLQNLKTDRNVSSASLNSQKTLQVQKRPIVYPAMLSRVAKVFKDTIVLSINTKDGLEYHDTFTGKMSVDIICKIIRTNDRNLALLLGRSLDAQKFFRDVTYNHRLRDSVNEVYAFNHVYSDVDFFQEDTRNSGASFTQIPQSVLQQQLPSHSSAGVLSSVLSPSVDGSSTSLTNLNQSGLKETSNTGVNGVFTILTDCYSPTCSRNKLCYSIACPRRLEQQARLNLKPQGGLQRAVSRLSLHDNEATKTLWHETVPATILDTLSKKEKMRQELIYEFIYTERDYVKDLEFMTDFYIMPLRNPANNIIPEREREAFIRTVFGGVSDLLRLAKSMSDALTKRQQQQKPVVDTFADIFLDYVGNFDPFIKYSGNKVFASFEHERQQQVNIKYARFLDAIEKKPESRKQDLSSFLIKGVQRPARYQLLLGSILKNTDESSPDYKNLLKAKEKIEKVLVKINIQTGESTDRHKIMVLHRLLGKQTLEERFNFRLSYNNRIIYQVTLSRKRDNEKIDLYLFEHALLLVKHKIQNKREVHKVFEKPIYLPLLFVNSGYDIPTVRSVLPFRMDGSILSDPGLKNRAETSTYMNAVSSSGAKLQINFLGLGKNQVHGTLFADDVANQSQVLQQIQQQQAKLIEKHDIFSLSKYETRRFHGNNKINCAVPCYGGKKLLYGTDSGVWVSTVRSISATSNEKICSDPTLVISKLYVSQIEVLVEYSKLLVLSEKSLYEFDLSCTDSLDHVKNTRLGKLILSHVSFFKTGICDGRLLVCAVKSGNTHSISIVEPSNPFDQRNKNRNRNRAYDIREIQFNSDPVSISFLKTKLCIGCTKGFEILSLEAGKKESILDEADPSLDFATQRESVTPLAIHRLDKNFLLSYSEFSFLINGNGWRTNHEWGIFWEGNPQNIALFYPYLLAFEPTFIEIRDLKSTTLLRALVGENIRFLHSNEHEVLYACEENGYDIIVSIDFLNLKPKKEIKSQVESE